MSKKGTILNFFQLNKTQQQNSANENLENSNTSSNINLEIPSTSSNINLAVHSTSTSTEKTAKRVKLDKGVYRYQEKFLNYGFTYIKENEIDLPQCVICGNVLANSSFKDNKLLRHLETNHNNYKDKSIDFFIRKRNELKTDKLSLTNFMAIDKKTLKCSFLASLHIAKSKKAYTIGEVLLKPCLKDICIEMFGEECAAKINNIPMSNDTVSRRITAISKDIEMQLIEKLIESPYYAIQLDESTDVSSNAILLVYVRYIDFELENIQEEVLCFLKLLSFTTSDQIFESINSYFEQKNIPWNKCIGICTDGAAAMVGTHKGVVSRIQQISHKDVIKTHCVLHREQLAAKNMSEDLHTVLNDCVKIVNQIRNSAIKTRIFSLMCEEMGSEHKNLLLYSHIRWLSRGKVLKRFFDLRVEIEIFLNDQKSHQTENFRCNTWLAKIGYLADIFSLLNELNLSMQGNMINLFICNNKIEAFIKKIDIWIDRVKKAKYDMFPCYYQIIEEKILTHVEIECMICIIQEHLKKLKDKFLIYFPSSNDIRLGNMWILNPFLESESNFLSSSEEEKLIELSCDKTLELNFNNQKNLNKFWIQIRNEYPILSEKAIKKLLPFATTYLAETGFSALVGTKNKYRNRLEDVGATLRIALSKSIDARINKLVNECQQQISH